MARRLACYNINECKLCYGGDLENNHNINERRPRSGGMTRQCQHTIITNADTIYHTNRAPTTSDFRNATLTALLTCDMARCPKVSYYSSKYGRPQEAAFHLPNSGPEVRASGDHTG